MKFTRLLYKSSLVSIIGVFLLVSMSMSVQAEDLHTQLNQSQQEANQLNATLNQQKDKVSAATSKVLTLKQSVAALNASIAIQQTELTAQQNDLKALESKQQELEQQRLEYVNALGQFLKNNYQDGVSTYLEVLFQATSLYDFVDRVDKVQLILSSFGKLQKSIESINEDMANQKKLVSEKKDKIQASMFEKQQSQQDMQKTLDLQKGVLDQLSSDEKSALNATVAAQSKVTRIQRLIEQEAIDAANAANSPISGGGGGTAGTVVVSGGAQRVINFSKQFLGVPYVWGGTTPSGFDCSGFVQYVYRDSGISLSRTSQSQFTNGIPVARANLLPGDIVFFHTYGSNPSEATHVGIYIGNNLMINSANGGVSYDNIADSYYGPKYLGARRVIAP